MWEQGWLLSHVVLVYSVITGSSQKNPDPSGQFRTIIGTLVRIRTKFRIPDLIEPRLGLARWTWVEPMVVTSFNFSSSPLRRSPGSTLLCLIEQTLRYRIWDLARKLATKAKFGPFGQNLDFFRTILGPFRDFLSLFSWKLPQNLHKIKKALKST